MIYYITAPPDGWRCMQVIADQEGEVRAIKLMMRDGTIMHDMTGFPLTIRTISDLEHLLATAMPGFKLAR